MTDVADEHERIDELLAGYSLRSLSGEDAEEVERVLTEHVPTCERCRETLRAFSEVGGELALAVGPVDPPDLLLPRLREAVAGRRPERGRGRFVAWTAAAAAAAAVIGMASWNTLLSHRVSDAEDRQRTLMTALPAFADPQATKVRLTNFVERPTHVEAAYYHDEARIYLVGQDIPQPAPGHVYRVWLLGNNGSSRVATDFVPDEVGIVVLILYVDPSRYSRLEITEEPAGPPRSGPSGRERWAASL